MVTLDCSGGATGTVYEGELDFETTETRVEDIPATRTRTG